MFEIFYEKKAISILLFASMFLSIFAKVFLGMLYQNMIKETENMAITENRSLKQCKQKFSNCYQLGNGVANVSVFVERFMSRLTIGKMGFAALNQLSGQLMMLSVLFSGIGIYQCISGGYQWTETFPFYIVSFFGLYLFFSISTLVDIRGKQKVLKINLVDYLENHFSPRIEVTKRDIEMLYGEDATQAQSKEMVTTEELEVLLHELLPL